MKFTVADAMAKLPLPKDVTWLDGVWDIEAFRHGTMRLELFMPRGKDYQTPHTQDELYIVVSGTGDFVREGERVRFAPTDVLFVAAGKEHHFENFSDDFVTWVVFWGPEGGEGESEGQ